MQNIQRARWRYNLRSPWLTWCLNASPGWVRMGRWIIRWEKLS